MILYSCCKEVFMKINNVGIIYSNNKSKMYQAREVCKSMGYELIYAYSCDEVLQYISKNACVFIILDFANTSSIINIVDYMCNSNEFKIIILNDNNDFNQFMGDKVFVVSSSNLIQVLKKIEFENCDIAQNKDVFTAVTDILYELGIPINMNGFDYLRWAVVEYGKKDGCAINIKDDVYKIVAERYNKTISCIEKGIRACINKANKNNKLAKSVDVLGIIKLSNSVVISYIADRVKLKTLN